MTISGSSGSYVSSLVSRVRRQLQQSSSLLLNVRSTLCLAVEEKEVLERSELVIRTNHLLYAFEGSGGEPLRGLDAVVEHVNSLVASAQLPGAVAQPRPA
jgi:hypothetical protein